MEKGCSSDFEDLEPEQLSSLLVRFYAEVRNAEGEVYAKKSLLSIRAALYRHLTGPPHNKTYNLLHDPIFIAANNTLMGQIKNLKASGQDESKHYPPITVTDIKKMYSTQVVSANSPEHLQNQVFFEAVMRVRVL